MLFVAENSVGSDWARLVLAEKEVDGAQLKVIRPGTPDEDFLILNPGQSLPTLADREGVLVGARVIVEYLDERYPHPPLMPQAPAGRARARMAMQRIEQELFPLAESPERAGTRAAQAAEASLQAHLRSAAASLPKQGWFLGREYTLVDCAWAALLRLLPQDGAGLPAEHASALRRYAASLAARPAFRRSFG
ncbi:MAG: glutathione S-transferase N-terminal domain-containing protein [Nevskia sp.]|nr:glutathione S-transferase N-terminal domain-containing protein [Nevskia sp.]